MLAAIPTGVTSPARAARSAPRTSRTRRRACAWAFRLEDLGGGAVALRAEVNGRYVCAEGGGAQPLVANRTAVGPWETFDLVRL